MRKLLSLFLANLTVPPHRFISQTVPLIGADPTA